MVSNRIKKGLFEWHPVPHSCAFNERIQFIILHYTVANEEDSLKILTRGKVSSHYLLGKAPKGGVPKLYPLVADHKRAWHAGKSVWQGKSELNDCSIGIEIVNSGGNIPEGDNSFSEKVTFEPFQEEQIKAVIVLVKDLMNYYKIPPSHVIGHSDVAPTRKIDPGAAFPWKRLAKEGIGLWPDDRVVAALQKEVDERDGGFLREVQAKLWQVGYRQTPQSGEYDEITKKILRAFHLHFRQDDIRPVANARTWALLEALIKLQEAEQAKEDEKQAERLANCRKLKEEADKKGK